MTDSIRIASNNSFSLKLAEILGQKNSYAISFDSLTNISIVRSDDNRLRIFTWILPSVDRNSNTYYGFIQLQNDDSVLLLTLTDSTPQIRKPESEILSPARWYGAIYYSILSTKKGSKIIYTLLGWKAINREATQKIVEIVSVEGGKAMSFGLPVIKNGSVYRKRLIFTYTSQASMVLRYEKKFGGIVFDHLGQNKNQPDVTAGPGGTYDGLKWKKGRWILYRDIDIRSGWTPNENLPVPPEPE